MMFDKLRLWLEGAFDCVICGERFFVMSFGFGRSICPRCYGGKSPFLVLNDAYWINRIVRMLNG